MDIFGLHRTVRNQMLATNETDTPVMAQDEEGKIYSIKTLEYEPQSDDGEGNVTSTGSTFFLQIEEI